MAPPSCVGPSRGIMRAGGCEHGCKAATGQGGILMKWENGPEISVMKKDGMVCEGLWWRLTFSPSVLGVSAKTKSKKPTLRSVFQFGGEGGIRTLDSHQPSVTH